MIAASKLIVSHFRRFGLTIHTGSKRKKRRLENGSHSLSKARTGIIGCRYGGHRNRRRPLYVLLRKMCGLTMWDVAEKRIKNEQVRRMVADTIHNGYVDGNAKMPIEIDDDRFMSFSARCAG
jgi:hypothetical protein